MTLKQYGILKGVVTGHKRDADDDHYQILVEAGTKLHRIASNVKSAAKNAPSTVLFWTTTSIPEELKKGLRKIREGNTAVASKPGGLALDYVRSGWIKTSKMVPVPPDQPGVDNDLKDKLEDAIVKAMAESGSTIYAFGEKWGPEVNKADKYFKFKPGNGIHDIHMNQGNEGKYKKDNGVYQDGAIMIEYPGDKWRAFFFAFQSQTFDTDANGDSTRPSPVSQKKSKKKKPSKKKAKPSNRSRK